MTLENLEILKTLVRKNNYILVRALESEPLTSEEIQEKLKFSRKMMYKAIYELKRVYAVSKDKKKYSLTQITKDILQHINTIEEIELKKLDYRLVQIVEADRKLSNMEDKQKILEGLGFS